MRTVKWNHTVATHRRKEAVYIALLDLGRLEDKYSLQVSIMKPEI